jgi:hypothetical protein
MLDPSAVSPQSDYRKFGDMFFDRVVDPNEVTNEIDNPKYRETIAQLRSYYQDFEAKISGVGQQEIIRASHP